MRLVVSDQAAELIAESGGHLYVWLKVARCCGAVTTLATSSRPPQGRRFRRVAAAEQFGLYLPAELARFPDELHLEVRRYPRRVAAYWNGCAWVA
jgi:hypothetical protein